MVKWHVSKDAQGKSASISQDNVCKLDLSKIEAQMVAGVDDGHDPHLTRAAKIFGVAEAEVTAEQRRYAKMVNFGAYIGAATPPS